MPSSYSPDLRIELIATGEQSGTWGATTNNNLGALIEDAISGLVSVTTAATDQALTAQNGAVDQARCAAVQLDTVVGAAFNVYVPPVTKLYIIENLSAYIATVYCSTVLGNTTAAGAGVAIPAGKSVLLRSDGTNILEQLSHVAGALTTPTAAPGTNTTQVATTAFVTDAVVDKVSFTGTAPVANQVVTYTNTTGTSVTTGRTYQFRANSTGQAQIQLFEDTDNGTNAVIIQPPAALAANYTLTLPADDGAALQFLQTDGSGVLSWAAPAGGGDVTFTGTAPTASVNQVVVYGATGQEVTTGRTYQFRATSAGQAQIQLFEDTDNGTNSVIIQSPAALSSNYTLTLPADDGTSGQVLSTNGTGTLSWVTPSSSGDVTGPASSTNNALARFDSTTGKFLQNSVGILSDTGALSGVTLAATTITSGTLSDSRLSSNVALLSGTQTFTGRKTFTGGIVSNAYNFTATNESIFGSSGLVSISVAGSARIDVTSSAFTPDGDNNMSLGSGAKRWTQVFAVSGTINTSDANTKQDIADLDDAEKRVAVRIKGLIKKFRFKDAVAVKGDAARIHVGVLAQEVRDAFTAEGLDASRYGLFCSDTWWEREEDVYQPFNETTVRKKVVHNTPVEGATEVTRLGVRYEELLAFVIAAM
jgi:hypothetical protein